MHDEVRIFILDLKRSLMFILIMFQLFIFSYYFYTRAGHELLLLVVDVSIITFNIVLLL